MKKKFAEYLIVGLCLFGISPKAHADIYNCGGVITNKPCSGAGEKLLNEKQSSSTDYARLDQKKKSDWIEDLRRSARKAEKSSGMKADIFDVEELCKKSSPAECSAAVVKRRQEIQQISLESEKLKLASAPTPTPGSSTKNTTVVIDNRTTVINKGGNHRNLPTPKAVPTPLGHGFPSIPQKGIQNQEEDPFADAPGINMDGLDSNDNNPAVDENGNTDAGAGSN